MTRQPRDESWRIGMSDVWIYTYTIFALSNTTFANIPELRLQHLKWIYWSGYKGRAHNMRYAHQSKAHNKSNTIRQMIIPTHQCPLFPQLPKLFLIAIPRNSMEEAAAQKNRYCLWHRLSIGCLSASEKGGIYGKRTWSSNKVKSKGGPWKG